MRVRECEAWQNRGRRRESVNWWMYKRGADVSQNWQADAAGAVHRGTQRSTQCGGCEQARVGRCAVGIGDPRVSLDALCRWDWRRKHLGGRVFR